MISMTKNYIIFHETNLLMLILISSLNTFVLFPIPQFQLSKFCLGPHYVYYIKRKSMNLHVYRRNVKTNTFLGNKKHHNLITKT